MVLRTIKPDKYDRYLADVFLVGAGAGGGSDGVVADVFLDDPLLTAGHAEGNDAWAVGDREAGA